jgi:AbrB family looped-hinge helix DNA binding protein
MVMYPVNVRHKGQITIPASIRDELGLKEGDRLLVKRRGQEIVLVSPEDVEDPTAGALAKYAYTRNPDPAEERRWVAQHIAETADRYNDE